MASNPDNFLSAAFTDETLTNLLNSTPGERWYTIDVLNDVGQDLLISFSGIDQVEMFVPATGLQRPFKVIGGFTAVWAKIAATGTGRVAINVG